MTHKQAIAVTVVDIIYRGGATGTAVRFLDRDDDEVDYHAFTDHRAARRFATKQAEKLGVRLVGLAEFDAEFEAFDFGRWETRSRPAETAWRVEPCLDGF